MPLVVDVFPAFALFGVENHRFKLVHKGIDHRKRLAEILGFIDLFELVDFLVGNEGEGLRQLTRKDCDELMALPMNGKVESLNAATAGSVMIYLAYLKRLGQL